MKDQNNLFSVVTSLQSDTILSVEAEKNSGPPVTTCSSSSDMQEHSVTIANENLEFKQMSIALFVISTAAFCFAAVLSKPTGRS